MRPWGLGLLLGNGGLPGLLRHILGGMGGDIIQIALDNGPVPLVPQGQDPGQVVGVIPTGGDPHLTGAVQRIRVLSKAAITASVTAPRMARCSRSRTP